MEVDAWSEWAGSAPQAPPGVPPAAAGPGDLDGLCDLVVTRAARLAGTGDALLWLVDDDSRLVVRRGIGRFASAAGRTLGKGEGLAGGGWRGGGAPAAGGRPRRAQRYRALSEQIPAVLYSEVHTPGGAVVYESPQYQQWFGYTVEDAMQPDFWKTLVHPDDREWVLAENERVDRTGEPWNVEYRTIAKDGRVVWLRDHAVLVRGEHGEPDYWQGYYIDITEQKQAEEALRQALEREHQALEGEG